MTRSPLLVLMLCALGCQDPVSSTPRATAFVSSPAMAVSAPDRTNIRIPLSTVIAGICTGEVIAASGDIHFVGQVWSTPESARFKGHMNVNLTGIGLSTGLRYEFQQIANSDQEFSFNSPEGVATQVFHLNTISQGKAANFYVTMNGTFLFGAGGVQFIPRKWEEVCR